MMLDNIKHLFSAYCVPGSVLNTLYKVIYPKLDLWNREYYPHFSDIETEAQSSFLHNLWKVTS